MHVAVAEAAAGRQVEVAHHLVDAQAALDAAALVTLLVQPLGVVLALALLDVLAAPEGPRRPYASRTSSHELQQPSFCALDGDGTP